MIDEPELWSEVDGLDSSGEVIRDHLRLLLAGRLDKEAASELLSDLVRDGQPSSAGYAALPFLLDDTSAIPPDVKLEMCHAACLIFALAHQPGAPAIPPALKPNFSEETKKTIFKRLFQAAAAMDLTSTDITCLSTAALLLNGHRDVYDDLVSGL